MAACLFCKSYTSNVHKKGCPFLIPEDERSSALSQDEYELFSARAQEWLDEEDASKPDMTVTLVKGVMIAQIKMMRDALLPAPGKDASMVSLRSSHQLAEDGEKFLGSLQAALTAQMGAGRVGFEDPGFEEDEDGGDGEESPPPNTMKRPPLLPKPKPKALPPAKKKGR